MKGGFVVKKIIYASGFLAAVPAVLLMLILHPFGSKFILSIEPGDSHPWQFGYEDLDNDSISEAVYTGKGVPYYFVSAKNSDGNFFDQWNLADSINPQISGIFYGDYDHDFIKEIYIFTFKSDSLFLNVNEMLDPHGIHLDRVFITKAGYLNGQITSVTYPAGFYDENGDGKDELYFGISSGFRKDPRRLYSFDLVNKTLNMSQFTGMICLDPKLMDIDGDGRPEIFGTMSACGNFGHDVPYSDSSTWFMVFDDKLKFKFPPVEFRGYVNVLTIDGYKNDNFNGYLLSHIPLGVDTTVMKARIIICSSDMKTVRYRLYRDLGLSGPVLTYVIRSGKSDRIYLLKDKFLELNEKLELIRTVDLPFNSNITPYQFDLNGDGEKEFLLYSKTEEKLLIYSPDLNRLAEMRFKTENQEWRFEEFLTPNHGYKVFLSSGDEGYFLSLKRNKNIYLGYLVFPGLFLLLFLFIILIKRINTLQVVQKEGLKRRLVTLQLQGIKSQLDPHFTFNTLNSIASLIYLEDRQLAYDYMNKFTHLLRSLINDAERIYRSLGEELEFVTTYLDLEKLRFGERFNYEICMGDNISQSVQVPKLVLHTFAENAIKHGIMSRNEGGILLIRAEMDNNYLILSIEDNGIGRANAEGKSTSTGKGLKLTGEFYDILNQINKRPIKHFITDLHNNNGESTGTRVEVWVPVD